MNINIYTYAVQESELVSFSFSFCFLVCLFFFKCENLMNPAAIVASLEAL